MRYLTYTFRDSGMKRKELEEKTGLRGPLLSEILSERINPRPRELALLAQALNVYPPEKLLKEVRIVVDDEPMRESEASHV